jgi:alpha-tubulin suppressor-like RCC1 family protein
MSNNYDISIKRGIGYKLHFNYLNEDNTPVDLSNTTGVFTVKRYPSSNVGTLICTQQGITATFIANDNNGYTLFSAIEAIKFNTNEYGVSGNTGSILISIPEQITHYVADGRYLFNLVLGFTTGNVELLSGRLDCNDNVFAGPILPIIGPTGSTGPKPSIRPFVVSSSSRAYALQEDDTIIYWGNIVADNLYSYRTGIIPDVTADHIRITPSGIIVILNEETPEGENTNLKFITQDDGIYVGQGISAEGMIIPRSENLKKIKDVVLTEKHGVALQEDGTVVVWGLNWARTENENTPADFPIGITFEKLSAGANHVLGLKYDGTVVAWGDDEYEQSNVPEDLTDVVEISAGINFSLARKSDNTVICWGGGNSGICNEYPLPEGATYSKLSAGDDYYLLLSSGRTLTIIPPDRHPIPVSTRKFKDIFAGYDFYVTIEDANSTGTNSRTENTINAFTTNEGETYGIPSTGLTGNFVAITSFMTVVGKTGGNISIHYDTSDYPNGVLEMDHIPNVSSIKKIATGLDNTAIVLDNNGTIYPWGNNKENLISIPYNGYTLTKQIEIGNQHAILLGKDGQVRCIGRNSFGQCDVPQNLSNVASVWAGRNFSGVIKNDGTIVGWGETRGYINSSTVFSDSILMPKLNSAGITGAKKVSVGFSEIFVLTDRGTIIGITGASWAAESNQPGSTYVNFFAGNFYTSQGYTSGISLSNIKHLSDQNQNTRYHFAISNSGVIYGWGHNSISPARNEIFGTPTGGAEDIAAGLTFKHVEKGQGLISAINEDNTITVWGEIQGYSLGILPEVLKSED